jgi:hypothetical protein
MLAAEEKGLVQYLRWLVRVAPGMARRATRPETIERWAQCGPSAVRLLPRAEANASFLEDLAADYGRISGRAHDAAWWLARREEFPLLRLRNVPYAGSWRARIAESIGPSLSRPFDPFNADRWAEATDPDDSDYLQGTAMARD